jgi:hypothetical protein
MATPYCETYRRGLLGELDNKLNDLDYHDTNNDTDDMIKDIAGLQKTLGNLLETIQVCEERKLEYERLGPEEMKFRELEATGRRITGNRPVGYRNFI